MQFYFLWGNAATMLWMINHVRVILPGHLVPGWRAMAIGTSWVCRILNFCSEPVTQKKGQSLFLLLVGLLLAFSSSTCYSEALVFLVTCLFRARMFFQQWQWEWCLQLNISSLKVCYPFCQAARRQFGSLNSQRSTEDTGVSPPQRLGRRIGRKTPLDDLDGGKFPWRILATWITWHFTCDFVTCTDLPWPTCDRDDHITTIYFLKQMYHRHT